MDNDERSIHNNKRSDKTYISRRFESPLSGERMRIASKVFDSGEGYMEMRQAGELVLRTTQRTRQEIVAKFHEDSGGLSVLTLQRFNAKTGPSDKYHFSFVGEEIPKLLQFIRNIRRVDLSRPEKMNISDEELEAKVLNSGQARRFFTDNEELFLTLAQNEALTRDVIAVGYRRTELKHFERLLTDRSFFASEAAATGSPEAVWQSFFEKNKWIFGYGLSYISMGALDHKKLEQVTSGYSVASDGKRVDAMMKTRAAISALCFIEIKRHDTPLLNSGSYRAGVWSPSAELAGGVAQIQTTVHTAVEEMGRRFTPRDVDGAPTGEVLFNVSPRSFLVIGSLSEFNSETGTHELKYRSFELFRRSLNYPEILTFDELLHRARYIVEHS